MKSKTKKEFKDKTKEELQKILEETREELFSLKMQKAQKKLKNERLLFIKRKDIARILSFIKEKEFNDEST